MFKGLGPFRVKALGLGPKGGSGLRAVQGLGLKGLGWACIEGQGLEKGFGLRSEDSALRRVWGIGIEHKVLESGVIDLGFFWAFRIKSWGYGVGNK